jgi:hypothetical protein
MLLKMSSVITESNGVFSETILANLLIHHLHECPNVYGFIRGSASCKPNIGIPS